MYKVIYNNKVIDVIASPQFLKILPSGQVTFTNKSLANGVAGSNNELYSFERVADTDIKIVSIEKIAADEFSRLQDLLNSEAEIIADNASLTERRNIAIENLSKICQTEIVNGFKVILSDGGTYHFKLTAEDQLNLLSIENQLNAGASSVLYHASGMPCKLFYREDMLKVIAAFRKHVLHHTTYFNVVKQYINTLTDAKKIETFVYGTDVSFATKDSTVKRILRGDWRGF
jgi:hypothetical protein